MSLFTQPNGFISLDLRAKGPAAPTPTPAAGSAAASTVAPLIKPEDLNIPAATRFPEAARAIDGGDRQIVEYMRRMAGEPGHSPEGVPNDIDLKISMFRMLMSSTNGGMRRFVNGWLKGNDNIARGWNPFRIRPYKQEAVLTLLRSCTTQAERDELLYCVNRDRVETAMGGLIASRTQAFQNTIKPFETDGAKEPVVRGDYASFFRYLDGLKGVTKASGSTVEFLQRQQFEVDFHARLDEVERALANGADPKTCSVNIRVFAFHGDATGRKLCRRLRELAARGVPVRVLIDEMGSGHNKNTLTQKLRGIVDKDLQRLRQMLSRDYGDTYRPLRTVEQLNAAIRNQRLLDVAKGWLINDSPETKRLITKRDNLQACLARDPGYYTAKDAERRAKWEAFKKPCDNITYVENPAPFTKSSLDHGKQYFVITGDYNDPNSGARVEGRCYAYQGGENYGDHYQGAKGMDKQADGSWVARDPDNGWHDNQNRIEGPGAAVALWTFFKYFKKEHEMQQHRFNKSWVQTTGRITGAAPAKNAEPTERERQILGESITNVGQKPIAGGVDMRLVDHDSAGADRYALLTHLAGIKVAQESIEWQVPYFGNDEVVEALKEAVARGVKVTVRFPAENDVTQVKEMIEGYIPELLAAGINVKFYNGVMAHAKNMVIDGTLVIDGSCNADARSYDYNRETQHVVLHKPYAEDMLKRQFHTDDEQRYDENDPHSRKKSGDKFRILEMVLPGDKRIGQRGIVEWSEGHFDYMMSEIHQRLKNVL